MEFTYPKIVKQNDVGDVFQISWIEAPIEFTFSADTTCGFRAKHLTELQNEFVGVGTVDVDNQVGEYRLKASDTTSTGTYKFEFVFNDSAYSYNQTYPKDETLTFAIEPSLA